MAITFRTRPFVRAECKPAIMESSAIQTYQCPQEADRSARPSFLFRQLGSGRRELLFWVLHTLFWVSVGLIGFLMTLAFRSSVPGVGWVIFMRMVCGFVGTAILRWIFRHSLFQQRKGLAKWPMAVGCCVAIGLVELLLLQALVGAGISFPGSAETVGARLLVVRLFIFAIWTCLYFAFHLLENAHAMELRATRAELAAREYELRHLQSRMNPHFIFNALNTVMSSKSNPVAVEEVTQSLADYLRFLLKETRPLEPLSREVDALERYLTLQAPHLWEKLICRIQCEKAARGVMVPPMMIQPLMEDAFRHRLQINQSPLQIWVTARVEKAFLLVTVSSTMEPSSNNSPPVRSGLQALEYRLRLLLGSNVRVEQKDDNGWHRVTLHVPVATG